MAKKKEIASVLDDAAQAAAPDQDLDQATPADDTSAPPQPAPKYTKCWLIEHPGFGSRRVFGDTKDEAIEEFRRVRCPETDDKHVLPQLIVREIPFTPADTELDKPYGWLRPTKPGGRVKRAP